jgi:hypothetical protein
MATYQVQGPAGAVYNVEGPEGADPSAIVNSIGAQSQESPAQQAARQTYQAAQQDQQYLDFGPWQTPVPIPHWLNNTLLGAGGRATQLGQWATQSLGGSGPDEMDAATQAQAQSGTAGKVGSFITDAAITAPLGGAVTSGVARLGGIGSRIAANTFGRAAVQGAVQGAATAPPGSRLEGAALGTALSPVIPLAGSVGGSVVRGLTRTPEAQALLDRGVQLTPGQMNPEGAVVNRVEQAFTSLPLVGGMIANARNRAPQQFARSFLEDATAPGQTLTTAKTDFNGLIADAKSGFDRAYDQTLRSGAPSGRFSVQPGIAQGGAPGYSVTQPLSDVFQQIADTPRLGLTASQRQAMGEQLQGKLAETLAVAKQAGGLTADDLQALRSDLRDAARDVSPTDNASRAQKAFWQDAQQSVTQALESQLPPDTAQALRAIDAQYSKFAVVRRAAVLAKDQPGGPTPAQFSQAIKEATPPNACRGRGIQPGCSEGFAERISDNGAAHGTDWCRNGVAGGTRRRGCRGSGPRSAQPARACGTCGRPRHCGRCLHCSGTPGACRADRMAALPAGEARRRTANASGSVRPLRTHRTFAAGAQHRTTAADAEPCPVDGAGSVTGPEDERNPDDESGSEPCNNRPPVAPLCFCARDDRHGRSQKSLYASVRN